MLLNFSDRTRTGVFNMIWPLARTQENVIILFQQDTYTFFSALMQEMPLHTFDKHQRRHFFVP